jgi:acyl carrier protein
MEDILKVYIEEELLNGNLKINTGDNLLVDGMVDSIAMLRLVNYIEELLDIKIDHDDLVIENFRTIQTITDYLARRGLPANGMKT